jgi:ABC-type multidrug transport system ATPase subunit
MKTFRLLLRRVSLKANARIFRPRWRLRHVALQVTAGERIGIMGANGAGKTSLARVMVRLDRPSRGRLKRRPRRSRVMLIMQRPEEHFVSPTVRDEIVGYARRRPPAEEVDRMLATVGLDPALGDRAPRALSSGQQRAVSIACGLATQPALLLLDEPMAGLDGPSRAQVMDALRRVSETRDMAIAIISHHPDDLLGWAQRLWIMDGGRLVYDGAFRSAPLAALTQTLDAQTPSVFLALRQLEATGYQFAPEIYDQTDAAAIAHLLDEGVAP